MRLGGEVHKHISHIIPRTVALGTLDLRHVHREYFINFRTFSYLY